MTVLAPTAAALRVGPYEVWPPVVLAPMAGITNAPFRRLCRDYGGGLYVSEMITTRALVERNAETMKLIEFGPDESPRSLQLYGVDPRDRARGRDDAGRRGPCRPHRPELRLPGAQGDPPGRGSGAAVEARPAARRS